jgi:Fic family protein
MAKKPMPAPSVQDLLNRLQGSDEVSRVFLTPVPDAATPGGKYRHWDTLRHLTPPEGLTHEEWWVRVKMARLPVLRPLPLADPQGRPFVYSTPDEALEGLHFIDQRAAGEVAMPEVVTATEGATKRYLVNSLIEEAIRSSQLEGAATSRTVAKEMIRSGRPPADRSERMIMNNYEALEFIRRQADEVLSPELVLELQRILTAGTLDDPAAAGRLQRPGDDRVVVSDLVDGAVLHVPPPAEQLPARLESLCRFANEHEPSEGFLHPVVRSILVHFWVGYDHPFVDGNGRTARALFYWSMRRQQYWLTEYLSISKILRNAPSQYVNSYLLTETDERDTTYFILFHLRVIRRAIEELYAYLRIKALEVREIEGLVRRSNEFNNRQLALLSNAVRSPTQTYTIESHRLSHRVTYQTARTDLLALQERGLITMHKAGKRFVFSAVPDLVERLSS